MMNKNLIRLQMGNKKEKEKGAAHPPGAHLILLVQNFFFCSFFVIIFFCLSIFIYFYLLIYFLTNCFFLQNIGLRQELERLKKENLMLQNKLSKYEDVQKPFIIHLENSKSESVPSKGAPTFVNKTCTLCSHHVVLSLLLVEENLST